jgi:arylsulfatase A-like enzyme
MDSLASPGAGVDALSVSSLVFAGRSCSVPGLGPILAAALLALGACRQPLELSQETVANGRGLLVIVVDALRFDHTSLGTYDRNTTPRLKELAQDQGILFNNAWSVAPDLIPAHVALLTGCDPSVARRPNVILSDDTRLSPLTAWFIPASVPRLAREFLANGWRTAAFVDHAHIGARRGFEDGFREFVDVGGERSDETRDVGLPGVTRRFYRWVSKLDRDEDWMAYLHWNDLEAMWESPYTDEDLRKDQKATGYKLRPDLDYLPPIGGQDPIFYALPPSRAPNPRRTLAQYELRYDAAIRSRLDRNLDRLFATLAMDGRWERTSVLVVGSFGIGFGESGLLVDSGTYSDVDLHVPVLLRPAPELGLPTGIVESALVSSVDLMPTLLDLVGIEIPSGVHGHSLLPLVRGEQERVRDWAYASHGPFAPPGRPDTQAVEARYGFAVIEVDRIYSIQWPGCGGTGALSASWFGDSGSHRREMVEALKVFSEDPLPGNLGRGPVGPDAARLRKLGRAMHADLDRVREVLHPSAWNLEKRGPEVIAELRAKGLIGDTQ